MSECLNWYYGGIMTYLESVYFGLVVNFCLVTIYIVLGVVWLANSDYLEVSKLIKDYEVAYNKLPYHQRVDWLGVLLIPYASILCYAIITYRAYKVNFDFKAYLKDSIQRIENRLVAK